MGALRKIIPSRLWRGQVTILVAGIMVVFLLLFLVVGIDFTRMYYVRGELQNAADAAALAGAKLLDGSNSTDQEKARQTAWQYACRNTAAGGDVYLATKGGGNCDNPPALESLNSGNIWSNTDVNASGDIVVGNWNGTAFTAANPADSTTGRPINAVQVVARRTGAAASAGVRMGSNPVGLLFGKLVGWPAMDVARTAIATKAVSFAPMPICIDTCNNLPNTPLDTNPQGVLVTFQQPTCPPSNPELMAWSDLEEIPGNPTTSSLYPLLGVEKKGGSYVLTDPVPPPNSCGSNRCLRTKQGLGSVLPAITAIVQGRGEKYQIKGHSVYGWKTVLPVFEGCASGTPCVTPTVKPCPGDQAEGYKWIQDAEVIITGVQETGPNAGVYIVGVDETTDAPPDESKLSCVPCDSPSIGKDAVVRLVK